MNAPRPLPLAALALCLAAPACDDAPTVARDSAADLATQPDAPVADTAADLPDAPAIDVPAIDVLAPDAPPDAVVTDALADGAFDARADVSEAEINPLGLTPGVPVTRPLGAIADRARFDLATASRDIEYTANLATQDYVVRLPARFDPRDPTRRYGLISYIDASDVHGFPSTYAATLDARDIVWIGGNGIGNPQSVAHRMGVALLGALRMTELYAIDPARVYVSGLSGGSRSASSLGYLRQDVFRGFVGRVGASLPAVIPGFQTAGTSAADLDADYELSIASTRLPVVMPVHFRTALMTQDADFRRAEIAAIYRYGHLNHGNSVRLVMRPGGHGDELAESFSDALAFLEHPALDVIWDRFEDRDLATNTDPGRTVAGSGFVVRAGDVREAQTTYNSSTLGVLRLAGDGAAVEARETFTWQDEYGLQLDARLRAETAAGDNQRIGVHIVPAGSTAPAATQPGLHLEWAYGAPHHVELVGADGARHPLASWSFATPHPMNLPTTLTSPQPGEGSVPEKTFWNATSAPDFAGASLRFRGEDVRVVLNRVGFQLTFNRPASGLSTPYAGRVVLGPTADGEELPIVLRGFWREVEPAVIAALPTGRWRLVITHDALAAGRPAGVALVDEVHLVGTVGAPAAPPTLRATTAGGRVSLAWTAVSGARGYAVLRGPAPAGPFAQIATTPGYQATYVDALRAGATDAYQVAAVGPDGTVGPRSPTAIATP